MARRIRRLGLSMFRRTRALAEATEQSPASNLATATATLPSSSLHVAPSCRDRSRMAGPARTRDRPPDLIPAAPRFRRRRNTTIATVIERSGSSRVDDATVVLRLEVGVLTVIRKVMYAAVT